MRERGDAPCCHGEPGGSVVDGAMDAGYKTPPNAPGPWALGPDLEKARQGKAVFNLGAMC